MDFEELIPGLPQDIAMQCLIRVSHHSHAEMQGVCRDWRALVASGDFYSIRKRSQMTRPTICFVQAIPSAAEAAAQGGAKQGTVPRFGLNMYDLQSRSWEEIPPIPELGDLPLFCQIVGIEGKIFVVGGWNPITFEAMKSVYCFEFSRKIWSRAADMSISRSFFACAAADGKIYVAGGHDENKNALKSCERFDPACNEWEAMADLGQERDECRGIVMNRNQFAVVSGYRTDSQGEFSSSSEIFDGDSSWQSTEDFGEGFICGSASGAVYCFRENGELLKMSSSSCSSSKKIGAMPVTGKIIAACSGSERLQQEIVAMVQDQGGVCRGVCYKPDCKDSWEILADGGQKFGGIVQAVCLVEV